MMNEHIEHLDHRHPLEILHTCIGCADLIIGWCDHGGLLCDECCAELIDYGLHAAGTSYTPDTRWYGPI